MNWTEAVYGAGGYAFPRSKSRLIGVSSERADAYSIQVQAATIAGLNGNTTFAKMVLNTFSVKG